MVRVQSLSHVACFDARFAHFQEEFYAASVESRGVTDREVKRVGARSGGAQEPDSVVVEEPLEIRLGNDVIGVTMRTPGEDEALAMGLLFSEGLVGDANEVESVAYCGRPGDEGYGNSIRVSFRSGAQAKAVLRCMEQLRELQPNFAKTGGIHAAGVFDVDGNVLACCEDIGRHNAVDKAVGHLLKRGLLGTAAILVVSGRSSFEIVQKAAVAKIPLVASVSAASSLAIDLAEATGVTLAAFVRNGTLNVYAHASRLT
jgi:FdhD protein